MLVASSSMALDLKPEHAKRSELSLPSEVVEHRPHLLARQWPEPHGPGAVELLAEARREAGGLQHLFGGFGVAVAGGAVISEVDAVAADLDGPDGDGIGIERAAGAVRA